MADPIIPTGIRVQAVFQGVSGLPEDRYVNTWAFTTPGPAAATQAQVESAIAKVRRFYTQSFPPLSGVNVMSYMTNEEIVAADSELRGYHMGDAPPREPTIEAFGAGFIPGGADALPSEVAVCLSFYANRNVPGQRGRIYFGPLGINALQQEGPSRPNTGLRQVLADAAEDLGSDLSDDVLWSVLGTQGGGPRVLQPVTDGWVDDSFDTQRRRGAAPTARTTFTIA